MSILRLNLLYLVLSVVSNYCSIILHLNPDLRIISIIMVIVDGYNVIYAWACLREAKNKGLECAREKLIQIMTRYQDFNDKDVSIVFDGSKRFDHMCSDQINTGVDVIFSKNGKTADSAIERMIYKLPDKSRALVVTSDRLIRMMVGGMGARSVSSKNFELMIKNQ